jgi:hypothetical protein
MTAPLTDGLRLHAVAAWDVGATRGAVAVLAGTSDGLLSWRARLEGVQRAVESGDCWSGRAAQNAVLALAEVSAAASAVGVAVEESLSAYWRLVVEAGTAQDLAERAVAYVPSSPGGTGTGPPAAEEALRHAALVAAAAERAGEVLAGLGVRDAFAPADFQDLLVHVPLMGPFQAPRVPATRQPVEVAHWWATLSEAQQRAVISASPAVVGMLDGVPAWARDRANRLLLDRALQGRRTPAAAAATARAVARRIAREEAAGQHVQVQLLDLLGDRVVLALGDLDTAETVAVLVPGVGNTPEDDLGGLVGSAWDVAAAARDASPGASVVSVVWLGYRTPANLVAGTVRFAAKSGGPVLAQSLAGLAAARAATATGPSRTTVVAHSYGTVVVDEAADEPGLLAADAVVLLGSPGMEGYAADLEAPEVFEAASPGDPVTWFPWDGDRWTGGSYGATGLPLSPGMGHSDYLEPEFPTLAAVGEVVAGTRPP